jgi:hypothetical protein
MDGANPEAEDCLESQGKYTAICTAVGGEARLPAKRRAITVGYNGSNPLE